MSAFAHGNPGKAPRYDFSERSPVLDLAGLPVPTDSEVWSLNEPTRSRSLDWSQMPIRCIGTVEATVSYVAELIKRYSPTEVVQNFAALRLLDRSPAFLEADRCGGVVPYKALSEVHAALGKEGWRTHYLRKWYAWCCDQGFDQFSPEVAFQLSEMRIGGNAKAVSVLSMDPESGPLIDTEIEAVRNALRASGATGKLDLQERAALWLCLALGCNPMQFVLLREGDFERLATEDGQGALYTLQVPRMKKGHAQVRTEFKLRKLVEDIGAVVEQLIASNASRRAAAMRAGSGFAAPIFSRESPRPSAVGSPVHEYAMGWMASEFTAFVTAAVRKLGVISPRTGKPIHATCRRFRYTYATSLVREGASQRAVAEALDHTDLQHVQCYFDLKSSIVTSLDRSMAAALGPVSQAFMGMLVRSEQDAKRGDRPSSRIHALPKDGRAEPVGTCGSMSFCGLYAPVACYTCVRFQAWMDGPHEEILEKLLADRRRRQEDGLDQRMVAIHDTTIAAVADVVDRIAAARGQET